MSIFGKKEGEQMPPTSSDNSVAAPTVAGGHSYGISDFIHLMRSLPLDQNTDLVVRVIRTTLESVNVHTKSLIDDAARHQEKLSGQIGTMQGKILELTKQIDVFRQETARLEVELTETRNAKERLESAEKAATNAPVSASNPLPPPTPPRPKSLPPKPTEPHQP
jgi:hypothetical protein